MSVAGSINQSKRIQGPFLAYLVPYPTGGYVGATDTIKYQNLLSQFYSDSATMACRALIPSIYSEIDAKGGEITTKQPNMEYSGQFGKYTTGKQAASASVSWQFKDIDANKIIDIYSAITGDVISVAAGAGVAGRKAVFAGRQANAGQYALMVRFTSEINQTGSIGSPEYRHFFIPMATIEPDIKLTIDPKGPAVLKLTVSGVPDFSLQSGNPYPPTHLWDDVIVASVS